MKNLRFTILTVVLLVATVVSASAQSKVATVDMKKLFNGYYKTKLAQSSLESRKTELRKEIKDMADGLDKAQTDYKQLLDLASDPAISAPASSSPNGTSRRTAPGSAPRSSPSSPTVNCPTPS